MENLRSLKEYLEYQNIDTSKFFHCINPHHIDRNPSMKYFKDDRVFCFGCRASYNIVDVISIMENVDNKEAYKRALTNEYQPFRYEQKRPREDCSKTDKNYTKAYQIWNQNLKKNKQALNYLKNRGIEEFMIDRFNLGFNNFDFGDKKFSGVVIPINEQCFTARNINDDEFRYYKPKGSKTDLFNAQALSNNRNYCVITEGEFDCLSFESIDISAIALSSVNNINKFINMEKPLNKTYILALDDDSAGATATDELVCYFEENNIDYRVFDNCGYKDANKALIEAFNEFSEDIYLIVKDIDNYYARKAKNQDAEM